MSWTSLVFDFLFRKRIRGLFLRELALALLGFLIQDACDHFWVSLYFYASRGITTLTRGMYGVRVSLVSELVILVSS